MLHIQAQNGRKSEAEGNRDTPACASSGGSGGSSGSSSSSSSSSYSMARTAAARMRAQGLQVAEEMSLEEHTTKCNKPGRFKQVCPRCITLPRLPSALLASARFAAPLRLYASIIFPLHLAGCGRKPEPGQQFPCCGHCKAACECSSVAAACTCKGREVPFCL